MPLASKLERYAIGRQFRQLTVGHRLAACGVAGAGPECSKCDDTESEHSHGVFPFHIPASRNWSALSWTVSQTFAQIKLLGLAMLLPTDPVSTLQPQPESGIAGEAKSRFGGFAPRTDMGTLLMARLPGLLLMGRDAG